MTNEEITEWEHRPNVINVLTSKEMGAWLHRRDERIKELEQRTGHWIETAEEYYKAVNEYGGGVNEDTPYFVDDTACSVCLAMFSTIDNETERFNYCPNCGAKMVDPQESEG